LLAHSTSQLRRLRKKISQSRQDNPGITSGALLGAICHVVSSALSPPGVGGTDDPRNDQQLVHDACAGDGTAFDALYYRYRDWVVTLAYRFTHNHDDALDVLQETFSYVLRKFPHLQLTASMKTFLYPAVRNLSIEIRRKRRRSSGGEEALAFLPDPSAATKPALEDLAAVLSALDAAHREVLLMRFVDGLKLEEIAAALSIPLGTVKSRMHNALQQLRADPDTRRYFDETKR
jgi:RNA polymerase sigma-70 factor (ECF subfamily)